MMMIMAVKMMIMILIGDGDDDDDDVDDYDDVNAFGILCNQGNEYSVKMFQLLIWLEMHEKCIW